MPSGLSCCCTRQIPKYGHFIECACEHEDKVHHFPTCKCGDASRLYLLSDVDSDGWVGTNMFVHPGATEPHEVRLPSTVVCR